MAATIVVIAAVLVFAAGWLVTRVGLFKASFAALAELRRHFRNRN
jgi:hypothetical protein